jgi:hypothetical protein
MHLRGPNLRPMLCTAQTAEQIPQCSGTYPMPQFARCVRNSTRLRLKAGITGNAQPIYGRTPRRCRRCCASSPTRAQRPYAIQFGSGDWITVVTRVTGTFNGRMIVPDGKVIAPTGKKFDLDFGQTIKWDGEVRGSITFAAVAAQPVRNSRDSPTASFGPRLAFRSSVEAPQRRGWRQPHSGRFSGCHAMLSNASKATALATT